VGAPETEDERFVPIRDARLEDVPWPVMTWPPPPDVRLPGRLLEVAAALTQRDAEQLFEAPWMTIGCGSTWPVAHAGRRPSRPAWSNGVPPEHFRG